MRFLTLFTLLLFFTVSCNKETTSNKSKDTEISADENQYEFIGGYPTEATISKAYDDADFNRAVQAYKFFYPTVSAEAIVRGNDSIGLKPNSIFGVLDTKPGQTGYTLNSDTPYGPIMLDLSKGPLVVEVPPGPLMGAAIDANQRWVADIGIPGPDEGKGGKHLLLPPGYTGSVPKGFYVWHSPSNLLTVGVRSLPVKGNVKEALERIKTIKVFPLTTNAEWKEPTWIDFTGRSQNTTPVQWETNIKYWQVLNEVIQREPSFEGYRNLYGELAVLGIAKGKTFNPDARMKAILEKAAKSANAQMRVQSFADRRRDRVVWKDRQWQWVGLRYEDGDFNTADYVDVDAREVWYYQAIASSPAMFRRKEGIGSLYWLGLKDNEAKYLDGGKNYKLSIPTPVPAQLFWSVTVYDAMTRSQIKTDKNQAALRSLFELKGKTEGTSIDLYFGPTAREGKESQWIKTIPGRGWFVYFRIYGPQKDAFNGSWKPGDFQGI